MHHSCGCCNDAALYARPFLIVDGERVHSVPSYFVVGEKAPYHEAYSDRPVDEWDAEMRAAGVPEAIIGKVADYFADYRRANADEPTEPVAVVEC
jgi:aminoglycoside phosphotransferase (APT) family kinase protein